MKRKTEKISIEKTEKERKRTEEEKKKNAKFRDTKKHLIKNK